MQNFVKSMVNIRISAQKAEGQQLKVCLDLLH